MNAAARELGLVAAARVREPILAKAREMCAEMGKTPHAALYPPLILSLGDRVGSR